MSVNSYAQQIIDFVRQNGAWAPPIVFALAFGKSLAFISLVVAAWVVLVAIGAFLILPDLQGLICAFEL